MLFWAAFCVECVVYIKCGEWLCMKTIVVMIQVIVGNFVIVTKSSELYFGNKGEVSE